MLKIIRNELSDILIVSINFQKLDKEMHKNFESSLKDKEVPKLDNFLTFFENKDIILESIKRSVPMKQSSLKP